VLSGALDLGVDALMEAPYWSDDPENLVMVLSNEEILIDALHAIIARADPLDFETRRIARAALDKVRDV
jgi:hypothetical protein